MLGSGAPGTFGSPAGGSRVIAGGIVAHNDEARIERSIRSLLSQRLPAGTDWGRIWVVASGCTDGTVEVARSVAEGEPRLGIVVEPQRRGKSSALREVLRRADGESLVLLNSDAIAAPGSVSALLARAEGRRRPFAVMGRPTADLPTTAGWSESMRWMWDLHHELHLDMLRDGAGQHLSDELWLVSLPAFPWIEDGIVNDGSYCAVWLRSNGGGCWYAPDARVEVEVPRTPADHLRQRRRIHVGNAQVTARLGRPPTTIARFLFEEPRRTIGTVRRAVGRDHGWVHLARVGVLEVLSHALAAWDRLPPRRDHVLWERIAPSQGVPETPPAPDHPGNGIATEVERRIRLFSEVARQFGTELPRDRVPELLPATGPATQGELDSLLRRRPDLLQGGTVPIGPTPPSSDDPARALRGVLYRGEADRLLAGPLRRVLPWIQCLGVTGSTAYGAPADGDDLDFFVVTKAGAVSAFLAATYAAIRIDRWRRRDREDPVPCFNYVVDARRAGRDLSNGRGLLFAREALTAQMLVGDGYYRGLLAEAPALGAELPRLYATRTAAPDPPTTRSAPLAVRALSALLFVPLAAYLHAVGLHRNAGAGTAGAPVGRFRTSAVPTRVAFLSEKFEQLRARYEATSPEIGGGASPSRMTAAR